ncbi:MAG TPA: phosphoribosyltransferase family protein [Candidatus Polarisedimenticolia bacterium]|nr:phosphoribosyltransferase family protein [Candidatus Polarisedimenticolia bacterium]
MFVKVRTLFGAVLGTVLPADCLVCERLLPWSQEGGVCPACWDRLPWAPRLLRRAACRPEAGGLWGIAAAIVYRDAARRLVHALKFERFDPLGPALGRRAAERSAALLGLLPPADVIVPVPLHWTRRFQRGFNQAEHLARGVARATGLPCEPRLLTRVRRGRRQRGLGHRARRGGFAGVFAAAPAARGARVLLVDDVVTTGTTIEACAAALGIAGTRTVSGFCVARTPRLRSFPETSLR